MSAVTILRVHLDDEQIESGAYVLRMGVAAPLLLSFGRFQSGRQIDVPAGEAIYIGSAMAHRGASTLARRLLRHATRTDSRPPHALRKPLLTHLRVAGMGGPALQPPATKARRWHVDYLLDQPEVDLTHVLVIPSADRLEATIARLLNADPHTAIIAPGLGASDAPTTAHLLHLDAAPGWWMETVAALSRLARHRE